jgi:hypothetical protein
MLSILLDIEWLLSTLFDASLLTFKPPETAALFFCCPVSGHIRPVSIADAVAGNAGLRRQAATVVVSPHLETSFVALQWNTTRH